MNKEYFQTLRQKYNMELVNWHQNTTPQFHRNSQGSQEENKMFLLSEHPKPEHLESANFFEAESEIEVADNIDRS